MANGLITFGAISGLGKGLADASQQGMQFLGLHMLAQERQKGEMARIEVMERYAADREGRNQEFQRGLQQERMGADLVNRSLDRQHAESLEDRREGFQRERDTTQFDRGEQSKDLAVSREEAARRRERERLRDPDEIAADAQAEKQKFEAGAETRKAEAMEGVQLELAKTEALVNSPSYMQAVSALAAAKEGPSQRADAALKIFELERSKEAQQYQKAYVDAVKSGDPEKVTKAKQEFEAFAQKPWEADKIDATHASQGLKESGIEITRLSGMMKDVMPGTPEAQALQRRIETAEQARDAYDARLRQLTGAQAKPAQRGGTVQINDPFRSPMSAPPTMTAQGQAEPPAPKPRGEKTVPAEPPVSAGRPDALSLAGETIKEGVSGAIDTVKRGASGLIESARSSLMPSAPPPTIAKESREHAMASLNRATPEQLLAERQQETQVREQQIAKPRGSGLISSAEASIPPAQSRPLPQQQPQPQERAQPQSGDTAFEPIIQSAAQKYGLRPDLLRSVIREESNFDPNAVGRVTRSGERAEGLTQMMPGTAKDMGVTDRRNPAQSIDGGAKYLAQLLQKYNGDEAKALAAYNFGPTNVDAGKPWPAETRAYVQRVLGAPSQGDASLFDRLSSLDPKVQQRVRSELESAIADFNAGRISEEQFRGSVLLAWLPVVPADQPLEAAEQARTIANQYIQQKGR